MLHLRFSTNLSSPGLIQKCVKCLSGLGHFVGQLDLCLSKKVKEIATNTDPNFSLAFLIKVVVIKNVCEYLKEESMLFSGCN